MLMTLKRFRLQSSKLQRKLKSVRLLKGKQKKHQNHMSSGKVLDKILNEMYEELYKRATPHASFKQLLKNANWIDSSGNTVTSNNEHDEKWFKDNGYKKDIHYKNYVIKQKSMDSAIRKVLNKYKNLSEFDIKVLMHNLSNGCGPLTEDEANGNNLKN